MRKEKGRFQKLGLTLMFAAVVFVVLLATFVVVGLGTLFLQYLHVIRIEQNQLFPLSIFILISLGVGGVFSIIFSQKALKPVHKIITAADQIAEGDYSVRLNLVGPNEFRQLSESFNHMASELGSVEMLRSDFINNFSHEFKTPIVSIRGFAKMLKNNDLTEEERSEYLDVIISESDRLTALATNVLNLSNVEQQSILTDKRVFNVTEQLRLTLAMMDAKFQERSLDVSLNAVEVMLCGNENLLKQVWINLLDNALKYSPEGTEVTVAVLQQENMCEISVCNQGDPISPEKLVHIFDKFYQGDRSHSAKGNGLGLTIAKKIVELHNGTIRVVSDATQTIFTVVLPIGL